MGNIQKIGLFGGTFAPPHIGHIHAVQAILEHTELDRVIVMPAFMPPHKVKAKGDTPESRLEMCRAAFMIPGMERVEVSDFEIMKGGLSYTVLTLEHLAADDRRLYLICGTDMFLTLPNWYRSDRIFELADIICIPRTNDEAENERIERTAEEYREKYDTGVRIIFDQPIDISSTEIRRRIDGGEDYSELVPASVREIIKREGLYAEKSNT